jgi:hypothetical protein
MKLRATAVILATALTAGAGLGRAQFRQVYHAVMETCLGVIAEHWPVVWRGRTAG